jgi:hypothetical protein
MCSMARGASSPADATVLAVELPALYGIIPRLKFS